MFPTTADSFRLQAMKQNKILWICAALLLAWVTYVATFDSAGNFDPIADVDVVQYRLGVAVGTVADDAERSIEETNENMQGVVNGRHDLNDRRVRGSGGG